MAVTAYIYGPALQSMLNAEIDFDSDTIKAMLCSSLYVPNQDTHRYKSDVTNEASGAGYTAGGVTLTTKALTYNSASNTLVVDCDDPTWATVTVTARYLVIYKDTGTAGTSPLIMYVDFGIDVSATADQFKYTVPAVSGGNGGLFKLIAY